MLPEQVWDEPDLPERDMYLGRPTGSAMPLMWAQAEYVRLLRSVADDRVFDLIPIVAARYNGEARKYLEVWKPARRVRRAAPGQTLRIQAPLEFQLRWTIDDNWTVHETVSTPSGLGIGFVDIPIPHDQTAPVRFAFCTPASFSGAGEEHEVRIGRRKNEELSE
jgi:glucoamylase